MLDTDTLPSPDISWNAKSLLLHFTLIYQFALNSKVLRNFCMIGYESQISGPSFTPQGNVHSWKQNTVLLRSTFCSDMTNSVFSFCSLWCLSFLKLHLVFILYIVFGWIRLQSLAKDIGLNKTSKNGLVHLDSSEFEWHFNITGFLQNDGHLLFENQASLKLYEDKHHRSDAPETNRHFWKILCLYHDW